ncbi:MAG: hypothetical protein K2J65_08665 [Duncaniella sp.]|nr:hypothetical protein [Duncaniella sp.]
MNGPSGGSLLTARHQTGDKINIQKNAVEQTKRTAPQKFCVKLLGRSSLSGSFFTRQNDRKKAA